MERIVYIKSYNAPKINKKEILRYCKTTESDEINALLDRCVAEVEKSLFYRVCYARYPLNAEGDCLDLGFAKTRSRSLAICLDGCDEIIVFCATVGIELDRLIKKYSLTSPSVAVMLQALGSERVEALCDEFCTNMQEEIKKCLRPRFSPGYGDLPLELQKDIFACLDPGKIGVALGENLFMTPSKSVTAIVGIKKES